MKRREFIVLLGGAAAWPLAAPAQAIPVIGFLSSGSLATRANLVAFFRRGLSGHGYVEGHNVFVDYRWADGRNDQLPPMAAALVRRQVVAIAAFGHPAVLAARTATPTIPVIFLLATDPVAGGLAHSLSRPGGNLTGVSTLSVEVAPKRLEVLRVLVPTATAAAILVNSSNIGNSEATLTALQAAARALSFQLHVLDANTDEQIDAAFAQLSRLEVSGLVIGTDAYFISRVEKIAALALLHRMPTIFHYRQFVAAGGLISYGPKLSDVYYQIGNYVGRILKGDKPTDLPIQQPTAVELMINLNTAKALGLEIPPTLLARADEVIE